MKLKLHIPLLPAHPVVRPIVTFAFLALMVYSLLAHWQQHGGGHPIFDESIANNAYLHESASKPEATAGLGNLASDHNEPLTATGEKRKVVAHFMLSATESFTAQDWEDTFDLAEETGLDGLVLNMGQEDWQYRQAQRAYSIAARRLWTPIVGRTSVKLFVCLDLNVMATDTWSDAERVIRDLTMLMMSPAQMKYDDRPILSCFDGHRTSWGGRAWKGFFDDINGRLHGQGEVFFWPTFFQPADKIIPRSWIHGGFSWESAWPEGNNHIGLSRDDMAYIASDKPFMAAVSPLFFTHYGKTGPYAWNQNYIRRSDDQLYPSRWASILGLAHDRAPEIVQVISWNDYGESHNIAPVRGDEQGAGQWTNGMDHVAFREMTKYFAGRYRDGAPEVTDEIVVWMWYRTHPARVEAPHDPTGPPRNREWAMDMINLLVLVPDGLENVRIDVTIGEGLDRTSPITRHMQSGRSMAATVPFKPGEVSFEVKSDAGTHMRHTAHKIEAKPAFYNFNMWSGSWRTKAFPFHHNT